ncbi:hypothetical protein [Sporosarcina sp. FSL K6-5500]|uniref:hypothetical protein n=1 Tax=Sporosarcina sp. FSL K6-5500 TaxID=2921558 RepID=UPI0030F8F171
MDKEFGTCRWYYAPLKQGEKNRIIFGSMDIGMEHPITSGITYKERGTINNLFFWRNFEEEPIDKGTELYTRLKKVINITHENIGLLKTYKHSVVIKGYYPIMRYTNENFSIRPTVDNENIFTCNVSAYDANQASGLFFKKVTNLLDFLSVETNTIYRRTPYKPSDNTVSHEKELFQEDRDFIDNISMDENNILISREGYKLIEMLTSIDELSPDMQLFLKACSHFHTGRAMEDSLYVGREGQLVSVGGGNKTEVATTLYLSALEVITLIGFEEEKCSDCGQSKFQIGRRVKQLTSRYLPKELVKEFTGYYDKRSKYLHAGEKLITETPTKNSVPLLDPDEISGCLTSYRISVKNVGEYVRYCIRNFYKEFFLKGEMVRDVEPLKK